MDCLANCSFFLLSKELKDPAVSTPFDLYEFMRVVEKESALGYNPGLVPRNDQAWTCVLTKT